jgi:hypothetical protein
LLLLEPDLPDFVFMPAGVVLPLLDLFAFLFVEVDFFEVGFEPVLPDPWCCDDRPEEWLPPRLPPPWLPPP